MVEHRNKKESDPGLKALEGKSISQEIWEAHINGYLDDEGYGQALRGLVGMRVRAMYRHHESIQDSQTTTDPSPKKKKK